MSVVCGDCIRYYHVKLCLLYALSLSIYIYIFIYKFVLYTTIFCLVNKSCVLTDCRPFFCSIKMLQTLQEPLPVRCAVDKFPKFHLLPARAQWRVYSCRRDMQPFYSKISCFTHISPLNVTTWYEFNFRTVQKGLGTKVITVSARKHNYVFSWWPVEWGLQPHSSMHL